MQLIRETYTGLGTAPAVARTVLAALPRRWRHTAGVARRAAQLRHTLDPADGDALVAAAWLHDIGYAEDLRDTGFHPLDGARFLGRAGWPDRISALVAHHSGACYVAAARGLDGEMTAFPRELSPTGDALAYADQTTSPDGALVDIRARMADMLHRHGPGSDNARVHHLRAPDLLAAAERVEVRLCTAMLAALV